MRVQGVQGQGCPQHESTQPGPLTLLPHKTRVRHKKTGTGPNSRQTSLRVESLGVGGPEGPGEGGSRGVHRSRGVQEEVQDSFGN